MAATERPLEGGVTSSRRPCLPPPHKLLGFKVVWFILEPLPLEVVGVLPSQALGVLPDVGTIWWCHFLHRQLRVLPLMAPRLVLRRREEEERDGRVSEVEVLRCWTNISHGSTKVTRQVVAGARCYILKLEIVWKATPSNSCPFLERCTFKKSTNINCKRDGQQIL